MTHALRLHAHGGPEVLQWERLELPPPGPGEVRLRQTAIGLNFIDVYVRSGLYPSALPAVLGQEAAGVVEALGPEVAGLSVGDRVVYAGVPGAYAEARNAPAARLVRLPEGVDDATAAASFLKGTTAEYLLRRTFAVKPGDAILVHSAAGGVGSLLCQWARHLGATVLGTVGGEHKVALARSYGCHEVLDASRGELARRVRELTGGRGVRVVYDAVGRDTFEASLDCLAPRGMLVSYGNASGPVPPFSPLLLMQKGSLFFTRPSLRDYVATREELRDSAEAFFDVVTRGVVRVDVLQRYPLREAARAHRDLEARKNTGASVLLPDGA